MSCFVTAAQPIRCSALPLMSDSMIFNFQGPQIFVATKCMHVYQCPCQHGPQTHRLRPRTMPFADFVETLSLSRGTRPMTTSIIPHPLLRRRTGPIRLSRAHSPWDQFCKRLRRRVRFVRGPRLHHIPVFFLQPTERERPVRP